MEELKKEIVFLKSEIARLEREIEKRKKNQIQLPLDLVSVNVVAKALQQAGYVIT